MEASVAWSGQRVLWASRTGLKQESHVLVFVFKESYDPSKTAAKPLRRDRGREWGAGHPTVPWTGAASSSGLRRRQHAECQGGEHELLPREKLWNRETLMAADPIHVTLQKINQHLSNDSFKNYSVQQTVNYESQEARQESDFRLHQ